MILILVGKHRSDRNQENVYFAVVVVLSSGGSKGGSRGPCPSTPRNSEKNLILKHKDTVGP